ncbi:integrase domain-containing protein, partial [Ectothiorhodospira sp. A-7R]|uniref:integrase domain-containing protein n=1 Tax=Ectothiorhodospira lacustris TaxID=2899127 RepID=UPI001EE7D296
MGKRIDNFMKAANEGTGRSSHATREARLSQFKDLSRYLDEKNIQIREAKFLTPKHVAGYIKDLQERGISPGSIQNRLATIRAAWRGAGCEKCNEFASKTNKELGADPRSRIGTKEAMSEDRYERARADLLSANRTREAAALELQRSLGLRLQEALRAPESLRGWERDLKASKPVKVSLGTKGGRPREVRPADRERALRAVQEARQVAGRGHLVRGESGTLKSAYDRLSNSYRAVGLGGREASHSVRYAFAREQFKSYVEQGHTEREARALTSIDLGHGDGRGRYVA